MVDWSGMEEEREGIWRMTATLLTGEGGGDPKVPLGIQTGMLSKN